MKFPRVLSCCIALIFFSSCSPVTQHYPLVDRYLVQQQFSDADTVIKKNKKKYGKRNSVLYYMDRAMMLHLSGEYTKSNFFLEKAEIKIGKLYRKSIITGTGALMTNDNLLPYEGEDFEKVIINIIAALNYVHLGRWDEALVEARKVDHKLNLFNDRYDKKNIYKEDAYARYLSGILYEAEGELNDAFIAYRKAYETYQDYLRDYGTPIPSMLPGDLLRITEVLGLDEEHNSYRKEFPEIEWIPQKEFDKLGEIIFISYNGRSPVKEDYFITVPIRDNEQTYFLRLALPRFAPQPTDSTFAEVRLTGSEGFAASQQMSLMEDITAIAKKNLEDRIARITAKAIVRATAKYLVAHEIRKIDKENKLLQIFTDLGTNIFSILSEQADKRSWRTLPGQIHTARFAVPPGSYTIEVKYYSFSGSLITRKTYKATIHAGKKKFLSNRFIGN